MPQVIRAASSLAAVLAVGLIVSPSALAQSKSSSGKFLVMLLTNHEGKASHKAVAERERESKVKGLMDDYEKAKKTFQEEKKAFLKKNPSQKFAKPEPQRPSYKVVKSGVASFNEAVKLAFELDKALEAKNSKH